MNPRTLPTQVLLIVTFTVTACATTQNTVQLTSTPCSQVTPVSTAASSKLLLVLVDRSSSYERFTSKALRLFVDLLPRVVSPGNQVIGAWIGINPYSPEATFFSESIPPVNLTSIHPQPQPPQKPSEDDPVILWTEYARKLQEYYCKLSEWNSKANGLVRLSDSAITNFLQKAEPVKDLTPPQGDPGSGICEALFKASEVFSSAKAAEKRLLILSDMEEFPPTGIEQCFSSLKLQGVRVIVAMFYADAPAKAKQHREEWMKVFQTAGATVAGDEFHRVETSTPEKIGDLLE